MAPLCFISCQERALQGTLPSDTDEQECGDLQWYIIVEWRPRLRNLDEIYLISFIFISYILWVHLVGDLEYLLKILDFLSFAQAEWLTKQFKVMNWNAIPLRIFEDFKHYKWSLLRFSCRCQRCIALRFWRTSTQMNQQRATIVIAGFQNSLFCNAMLEDAFSLEVYPYCEKVGSQLDMEENI